MKVLPFRELGQGPALVILHGMYGYGRTWMSLARRLSSDFRVILPDLRNHGEAFHDPEMSYPAMASDLSVLLDQLQLPQVRLIGHSMGGKVAMQFALAEGRGRVSHLGIIDISLRAYNTDYHAGLLSALTQLDLTPIQSRQDADQALAEAIPEAGVRSFLVSNLQRVATPEGETSGWRWQLNLPALQNALSTLTGALIPTEAPVDIPVLCLAGADSAYVRPEDEAPLRACFPQLEVERLPAAGHWVHVDQPEQTESALRRLLAR
ncbi:MAG: alpha/beta fold hydrolase [Candidatus Sericytochromatia bacterium]